VSVPEWNRELLDMVLKQTNTSPRPGRLSTALTGELLATSTLAGVLRNLEAPTTLAIISDASLLVMLPRLMLPHFNAAGGRRWSHLVGAANMAEQTKNLDWRRVLDVACKQKVLRLIGHLWSAGDDIAYVPADPAFDARALVALSWMRSKQESPGLGPGTPTR
jgi:hypothetical protein